MANFSLDAWQVFGIDPNDTLTAFGTKEYTTKIKEKYRTLSRNWHPDKNHQNKDQAETISKVVNGANEYLLSDQSRLDLINWYIKNQTDLKLPTSQQLNCILKEFNTQQPTLTATSTFSWMSMQGILSALDWFNTHLFYGISWVAWFLSLDIAASLYIPDLYGIVVYIAVQFILLLFLKLLVRSEDLYPSFLTHLPYFTMTALMMQYGLIQPTFITTFLTSMSPLSLI